MLLAPCKVKIYNLIDGEVLMQNSDAEVSKGYGVLMKPLDTDFPPDTYFLYWHCRPVFPVNINDIVEQGQPVAQMGNSGYVMTGGKYIPINQRDIPPFYGTHLHFEYFTDKFDGSGRNFMDVLPLIDWTIPVSNSGVLGAITTILAKISSILKK